MRLNKLTLWGSLIRGSLSFPMIQQIMWAQICSFHLGRQRTYQRQGSTKSNATTENDGKDMNNEARGRVSNVTRTSKGAPSIVAVNIAKPAKLMPYSSRKYHTCMDSVTCGQLETSMHA